MSKDVSQLKMILFDLDGTVYHDDVLIGNAKQTFQKLRDNGIQIVYLTNNSSCTKNEYVEKLTKIGIFDKTDIIYSSLDCAVDFLNKYKNGKTVYAVATKKVKEFLSKNGIKLSNKADIVLLTFDKELNYKKIVKANELIANGSEYIVTHPDFVCPTKGVSIPDVGSFIELFKASNGKTPSIVIGKPYRYMAEFLLEKLKFSNENVAMVGDRIYTDIQFGVNSKITSILVLSGETTLEQYKSGNVNADYVLQDINFLPELLKI